MPLYNKGESSIKRLTQYKTDISTLQKSGHFYLGLTEQTVSLLLFGLLHRIDAYAEWNADKAVIETSNCIDDAA